MMWSASLYSKTSPFLVIILGTLVILTLGYISIAQTRHIEQLGETISHLCMDSPFNELEKSDQLSENGEHFFILEIFISSFYVFYNIDID